MPIKKKPTRKELLKEPDEFLTLSRRMLQYATAHRKAIAIAAAAFFGVLVVFAGFRYYTMRAEDRAFGLLDQAVAAFDAAAEQSDPAAGQRAAEEAFTRLFDRYEGKAAAAVGRVVYADICYRAGAPKKAIEMYTEALNAFETDPALLSLIYNGLGSAWEAAGDLEKAAENFRRVAEGAEAVFKDDAMFQLARIYERMGRTAQGAKLYEQIPEQYPASLFGEIAREKAARKEGA